MPEELRVKFINIAKHVVNHAYCKGQFEGNPDAQNREFALENPIQHAVINRAHPGTRLV